MTITITDLGGISTNASGINAAGQVVGDTTVAGAEHAFLWQGGAMTDLGTLPGDSYSAAYAINSQGEVAGFSSDQFNDYAAVLWQNGTPSALGSLQSGSQANAINDKSQVVGAAVTGNGAIDAFLWQNGTMMDLGTLPGAAAPASNAATSAAYAINNAGQVVGMSLTAQGIEHAVSWQNGLATDLGTLPGATSSEALAINDKGQIVGDSTPGNSNASHAALWQNGSVIDLGALAGNDSSSANAIDGNGDIVGWSDNSTDQSGAAARATLWQNGNIIDLNTLLPANSGWTLNSANGINDQGQIVGSGLYDGAQAGFLLSLDLSKPLTIDSAGTAIQLFQSGEIGSQVAVADSAANLQANLDALQTLAAAGKLASIALTDAGAPTLSPTPAQTTADAAALKTITGSFMLSEDASAANATIAGVAGHADTVIFPGPADGYTITATGDGISFTVSSPGSTDHLSNITALQFSDHTEIVASQTTVVPGAVSSAQITELYGAVLGRIPDVAGLAYYENYAAGNPSTPFTQFAQWFLSSPEYTGNPAHSYPQTAAGDAQFISDSYENLLHRAPGAGDAAWYQSHVIDPMLSGLTPGTAAYGQAELSAHAQVLAYFSQSPEFLGDVTITAQHPADAQHWLVLT